jgi:hypothetical protein
MTTDQGHALEWNDAIENDGDVFTLLEPGEYPFRVIGFERARHGGSAKLPPCNKAVITLDVGDAEVATTMKHNLFLHTKCEGMLCEFFRAIGARKHGERLVMDWSTVVGATGRCRVKTRTWKGKDGEDRQSNDIDKFFDCDDTADSADNEAPW